jgi:hypothetical protein
MTNQEKSQILEEALERAYKQLDLTEGCEMGSDGFGKLLYAIQSMDWMRQPRECLADFIPETVDPEVRITPETTPAQVQPAPAEPETVPDEVRPQYKMEEVRAALAKARGKGVNVSEIIRSFGADNFQQITPDKYPAIMEKLA